MERRVKITHECTMEDQPVVRKVQLIRTGKKSRLQAATDIAKLVSPSGSLCRFFMIDSYAINEAKYYNYH